MLDLFNPFERFGVFECWGVTGLSGNPRFTFRRFSTSFKAGDRPSPGSNLCKNHQEHQKDEARGQSKGWKKLPNWCCQVVLIYFDHLWRHVLASSGSHQVGWMDSSTAIKYSTRIDAADLSDGQRTCCKLPLRYLDGALNSPRSHDQCRDTQGFGICCERVQEVFISYKGKLILNSSMNKQSSSFKLTNLGWGTVAFGIFFAAAGLCQIMGQAMANVWEEGCEGWNMVKC